MIKFHCSYCAKKLGVPVSHANKFLKCPKCACAILVPATEGNHPQGPLIDNPVAIAKARELATELENRNKAPKPVSTRRPQKKRSETPIDIETVDLDSYLDSISEDEYIPEEDSRFYDDEVASQWDDGELDPPDEDTAFGYAVYREKYQDNRVYERRESERELKRKKKKQDNMPLILAGISVIVLLVIIGGAMVVMRVGPGGGGGQADNTPKNTVNSSQYQNKNRNNNDPADNMNNFNDLPEHYDRGNLTPDRHREMNNSSNTAESNNDSNTPSANTPDHAKELLPGEAPDDASVLLRP